MAQNVVYARIGLTGGSNGYLDDIDGDLLQNNDIAIVVTSTGVYIYHLNSTSGASESSPSIISPDTNAGNKRWELVAFYNHSIYLTDDTDQHIIKAVQESGLGGRLTIGLDETARTMLICDYGDIDTDHGLSVSSHPSFILVNAGASAFTQFLYSGIKFLADLAAGDMFTIDSDTSIELTDTDGEQSWVMIAPKINQSGTGAYNALKVNVTETATGDGSTGDGNCLINLAVGGTSKFDVDNSGNVTFAGVQVGSHDDITATSEGVAASVATETTFVTTNGDSDLDNVTLADGVEGQTKYIVCVVEGNAADTWKITPANMVGGTQITFAGVGEGCVLKMYSAGWVVTGNNGGTIS